MAEFKLGRLRFVWKGEWVTGTAYVKDDIIRYGGKSYVALTGHTASLNFYTDSANWELMSDGVTWQGTWSTSRVYKVNDIVKFGAKEYICLVGHTSSSTPNSGFYDDLNNATPKWSLLVDGVQWKSAWSTATYYKIGDIVRVAAKNYICLVGHTSSSTADSGFYDDLDDITPKWALYTSGLDYAGSWTPTTFYDLGDIVKYGGLVYHCTDSHTSQAKLEDDQAKWDLFVPGFDWKGNWSTGIVYKLNDVVKYGANQYICITPHTSAGSELDLTKFSIFSEGLQFEDAWDNATSYQVGDVVTYGGYVYSSTETNNTNHVPSPSSTFWSLVTTGFELAGVWNNSTAYKTGDVVTYGAYVYVAKLDNTATNPAATPATWSLLNTGINWVGSWQTATTYKLGDAIGYASNSYICVQEHTSSTPTRPDNDLSGTYWNALSQGAATNVTTTRGDLIYYSASGNARLPIGTDGQVLRVVGQDPVWKTINLVSNVYYVAPTGSDAAGYGLTLEKPWKTICYACQQIEAGPANPNAQFLLTANKAFIAAEVDNYLSYTYKAAVTGTSANAFLTSNTLGLAVNMPIKFANLSGGNSFLISGSAVNTNTTYYVKTITTNTSFTITDTYGGATTLTASGTGTMNAKLAYDSAKTQRDADYVLDAIIFDIGRGGTIETVINAKSYYAGENTYITTNTQYLVPYFVASLNYLATLSGNVLANTPPASNYQTLNGVGSPVVQVINLSYTTEAGIPTTVTDLVSIITTGLSAGTTTAIPAPVNPNVTLNIKTGTYPEVLPISVPAFTALVGDELRSTVVQPYTVTVTAVSGTGNSITLSDATNVVEGMGISGHVNIPAGTKVSSKLGNVLTLNQNVLGDVTGTVTVGYTMSNMFYMRNGSGARNMTVTGLLGALTAPNAYNTRRPTSGAFFSLDPGTGPDDERMWITTRSPYMQNISLFGTGCVGMKVDGALHNGGNKSMVANDFTNILSDGIAIWCTNLALVEAVSVFSYYGYIGYLSELGGKIRATNGNSSYGTYGTLAEGGNPSEVPITGTVNTRSQQAQVGNVLLGGGQILWVEYTNAGQSYSNASYAVFSSTGVSASTASANVFNNAISEVRIISGGSDYVSAVNNAQTGNSTSLTLSAADIANTASYNGMRIVLTDGTGSGQYGYVGSYNGATKVANMLKESFTPLTITTCDTTKFTVGDTTTIPVGTPIMFQGTTFGGANINKNDIFYVVSANFTASTFSVATTPGGPAVSLTAGTGSMTVVGAGWDVAVVGTPVITNLDFTSRYIVEPRVTFTNATGSGALVRAKVISGVITEFRVINPGSGYLTTPTIVITDPNVSTPASVTVRKQDGVLGQPTWTSRGSGYKDASVVVNGNGFADIQPVGYFIYLSNLSALPVAGSNLVFQGNTTYYTLVQIISSSGSAGNYSAYIQVNPGFTVNNAPAHGDTVNITIQYSQVRLTGHDFLYVGSGNFGSTGYPNNFSTANFIQTNETVSSAGGRVFYTSTDQDGNFRVGNLFTVQQATGVATLNANLFNLSGLNALQFASGGASVTQFSTDATFSANSDVIVPTQRAIKAYLASQLGAGGAVLAVSSLTSGNVVINGNQITTQNSVDLNVTAQAGKAVVFPSTANVTGTMNITNTGSLVINGTGTQNVTPVNPTDITNKKYVDRALSLNTMWTNAW